MKDVRGEWQVNMRFFKSPDARCKPTHIPHSPPMVVSWNSSNWPLTKRSTRLDLPTAMSPSSTNLNWQILVCGSVPLERPPLPLELILNPWRSRWQGEGGGWGAGPPPWGGDGVLLGCFSHLRCLFSPERRQIWLRMSSLYKLSIGHFVLVQDYIMALLIHTFIFFLRATSTSHQESPNIRVSWAADLKLIQGIAGLQSNCIFIYFTFKSLE